MANAWFETVAEAQRRAKKRLPAPVYGALMAGQESGVSRDGNLDAFAQLGLAPEVANKPPTRELATSVMGQPIYMPVMISPTGVTAVHPDGEVAVARAAAARGTALGPSSFASQPVEEVVERSEEHTSELQSLMRISYAVFCLKKKTDIISTAQHYSRVHIQDSG